MEKRKKLEAAALNENNFRVHALPVENIYSPEPKSMRGTGKENPLYDFLIDINKGKNTHVPISYCQLIFQNTITFTKFLYFKKNIFQKLKKGKKKWNNPLKTQFILKFLTSQSVGVR